MRKLSIAFASVLSLAALPALAAERATAQFVDADGNAVGSAVLQATPHGVLISAEATGITPGVHGFHIHETGECNGSEGFESAGGHYAPMGNEHGFLVEGGPHAGDMPNVNVQDDGVFVTEVHNDRVSLDEGAEGTLFDEDGSALIIHSGADDYESQPSGAAGSRIACAVIEPAE